MRKLFLAFTLWLSACGGHSADHPEDDLQSSSSFHQSSSSDQVIISSSSEGESAPMGKVTFFNESSYRTRIHQSAFSGAVLLELSAGASKAVDVRASDNYGVGSMFSIEYLYQIGESFDEACGKVQAIGIDPNIQLNLVIENGKKYTLQIPQPKNLEFPKAYIKISNASDRQIELHSGNEAFRQAGCGDIPVPAGKTTIYEINAGADGIEYKNLSAVSVFESIPLPNFSAKSGTIYSFIYKGTSVAFDSEQKIIFK